MPLPPSIGVDPEPPEPTDTICADPPNSLRMLSASFLNFSMSTRPVANRARNITISKVSMSA